MQSESEPGAFDRLSNDGKKLFQDPQVRVMIRGSKPAVYLGTNWESATADADLVRQAFASLGVDAVVLPGFVGDKAQIQGRLNAEPGLAETVGWDASRSIEENMARPETTGPGIGRNHGLLAFVLGYPKSAIDAFLRREKLKKRGVPTNAREFFVPNMNPSIADTIRDPREIEILSRLHAVGARAEATRNEAFERAGTREDRSAARHAYDEALREHEKEVRELLQTNWNLSESETDDILVRVGIRLRNATGEDLYFFTTCGKDAENAPDILALEERIAKTEGPMTRIVEK